jgi:hypothetical protein
VQHSTLSVWSMSSPSSASRRGARGTAAYSSAWLLLLDEDDDVVVVVEVEVEVDGGGAVVIGAVLGATVSCLELIVVIGRREGF